MADAPAAALYFPYRTGPDEERVLRNAPETDRSAQAVAVGQVDASETARRIARPFWYTPVVNAFTIATPYWWIGVMVTAIGVAVVALLSAFRARQRNAVRRANHTIGFPVPGDLVDEIADAGGSLLAVDALFDLAERDRVTYDRVRVHQAELVDLEEQFVRRLLDARRYWVASDVSAWRDAAADVPRIAHQIGALARTLTD